MVEKNPWYKNAAAGGGPDLYGCVGVKADGGGSMRGRGIVGKRLLHMAVANKDLDTIATLVAKGEDVNEVDAAGNTPLHMAAYTNWMEGAKLLLELGAKIDASNNAGDRPVHWAGNMRNDEMVDFLTRSGAKQELGRVIVPEHIPKVKDFYEKDPTHPKPSAEWMAWRKAEDGAF